MEHVVVYLGCPRETGAADGDIEKRTAETKRKDDALPGGSAAEEFVRT